jgi:hypothetical protein
MNQGTLRDGLISSPGGSRDNPASLFPMLESEKEWQTSVTSGRRCLQLSESLNRPLSLAKMLLVSSVWTMARHLKGYSLIWKMKGIKPNHLLFQLAPLVRGTDETGFGSYATGDKLIPTPDALNGGEITNLRKDSNILQGGSHSVSLTHYITLFATPNTQVVAMDENLKPGQGSLNPNWVEWLMGYPLNWTDIGTENPMESQELPPE